MKNLNSEVNATMKISVDNNSKINSFIRQLSDTNEKVIKTIKSTKSMIKTGQSIQSEIYRLNMNAE
jgi:hypothetical protein